MRIMALVGLVADLSQAQKTERYVVFSEDFQDLTMPAWHGSKSAPVKYMRTPGPNGLLALEIEMQEPVSANLSVRLPVEQLAGRAVLLEVWRKAENVKTDEQHYDNAMSMLVCKAKSAAKPQYSETNHSNFSGTFDWERHRFVMKMPEDLDWAAVTIGMQACTGKASWASLTVSVDPKLPNQQALEQQLAREELLMYENLDAESMTVKRLDGGGVQVFSGYQYVPRKFWNSVVRKTLLATVPLPDGKRQESDGGFRLQLLHAMLARAKELETELAELKTPAVNDRVLEIVSLRQRVSQLEMEALEEKQIHLKADGASELPVSLLIFGNNINTQNLTAPYDSARGKFQDEFLNRVRPMGITFLRYPGGCNADVFDWRDTIGPLGERKDIINFHNGKSRGIAKFGVDEYLRFCEEKGMVPIITTAFCKDRPENVDLKDHPNGIRHKYVFSYLKSAPERVQLAADWVEYCNGSVDTPLGKLRAQNGHPEPYHVKYWEIGNESYGPDPIGSCTPEEYASAIPAYVRAMKARDPSIKIVINGHSKNDWNEPLLRIAGEHADAFQFHLYRAPRINNYSTLQGRPRAVTIGMRQIADGVPDLLGAIQGLMKKYLGRTLPIIISEFGMGDTRNREFMTSVASSVMVADIWRTLAESPAVIGANKWCLFTGDWSQIQGPTFVQPDTSYYNRPEHAVHVIYARCRGEMRLAINNDVSEGARVVVFKRADSYGLVLISREAVSWQSVVVDLPGAKRGIATCLLMTAGHPFLGNENDNALVGMYEFEFDYEPGQPVFVPSNSVMGLIVPK